MFKFWFKHSKKFPEPEQFVIMPVITGLNSTNLFSCIPPVIDM